MSRRVIFRGQGEVGTKLKLDTDITFAPFNLDLLEIPSYEFSWGDGRGQVTRRDGLASWRVIFFVTAGMLSGK